MSEIDSKRMIKIISIGGSIAMLLFTYMVICFFRLDWIRFDEENRYWQVESMQCENQAAVAVIRLYKKSGSEPDIPIRYSKHMYEHLKQQQEKSLPVKRKLVGYLREWDYGVVVPLSIAGKIINKHALLPDQQYLECAFTIDPNIIRKSSPTRRKMR